MGKNFWERKIMKIYPPPEGLTSEEIRKGHWTIYADVKCIECGKEHALTNAIQTSTGPKCIKCGGRCE